MLISLLVLISLLSVFNNNYYRVWAEEPNGDDYESLDVQHSSQESDCKAGEDNNNSCNNISISRQGDGDSDNGKGNKVQVSKQGSSCEAGEDNNNSCNN
ncbi:MAG: hypothetical protein AB7V56_07465, partial [Candidatus Nitrosocosmicus sp.]